MEHDDGSTLRNTYIPSTDIRSPPTPKFAMDFDSNPLQSLSSTDKPFVEKVAEPLSKFRDDPIIQNPIQKVSRAANVISSRFDPLRGPHSVQAQKLVLAKGIFNVFLSLSLIFFPSMLYDGPLTKGLSFVTGLPRANWEADSPSAFAFSSLIMGCGIAAISAAESTSDDAYKVVAALNGAFAFMSLLGCLFRPHEFGSSFLFIAGLQDVFWFYAIIQAGGYNALETLGLSWAKISKESDKLAGKAAEQYAAEGTSGAVQGGIQGAQSEGQRVLVDKPVRAVN